MEAFLSPAAAKELFDRRDRSVLVLSYRWAHMKHPDIKARTLRVVLAFLRASPSYEALFWDFALLGS